MSFFIGVREAGRTTYFNVDDATSIAHDQTSIDRARWSFRFGFFGTTSVVVQQDLERDAYDSITRYFRDNSSGV
ncbi:MAG: hypothetical protein ACR2PM_04535 [Hyphomicrobiales bacterium]